MTDILSALVPAQIPDTLYHYTTQAGLIGIIQDDEIWATHTQYLNDRREYIHALDLVREELGNRRDSSTGQEEKTALEGMITALGSGIESINICVCSFSENGDSLSQWRAYGESTAGFAIGFSGEFLAARAKVETAFLVRCVYRLEEQQAIVRKLVDIVLGEVLAPSDIGESDAYFPWRRGGNILPYLHRLAPAIKDQSFEDEKEWRIISRPLMCSLDRFNYRQGRSTIVPYYRFPLPMKVEEVGLQCLREVVIGPTPDLPLSAMSVRGLLASRHMINNLAPERSVSVRESTIPYRAW